MISYMMVFLAFLARMISYQKLWYYIWYHSPCCDIMYDITKTIIKSLSCAIFIEYCLRYHIHILWICPWYQYYAISYLLLRMIYAIDISITRYHGHTISHILWYLSLCHGTCAAGWHGFKLGRGQAPGAPPASPLPKYWGQQSESYYPSFHIMIPVVVKFRTRPLRLIVTDIPPGIRRQVTRQTRSHWPQPQADSGSFKLRTLIMPGVTLVHDSDVTARALIIEIQLYTAPLRKF
jgi:hypothetical protein